MKIATDYFVGCFGKDRFVRKYMVVPQCGSVCAAPYRKSELLNNCTTYIVKSEFSLVCFLAWLLRFVKTPVE